MNLQLNFVYGYEAFNAWTQAAVNLPSTATWEEARAQAMVCSWMANFRAIAREWERYAWPGGYEIHYITKDCAVLCHQCANKELERTLDPDDDQFFIVAAAINYEDPHMYCDHCNRHIESAYETEETTE